MLCRPLLRTVRLSSTLLVIDYVDQLVPSATYQDLNGWQLPDFSLDWCRRSEGRGESILMEPACRGKAVRLFE